MKKNCNIIVQASSKAWSGATDMCVNTVNGKPAILHTIENLLDIFPDANIVVAAPDFDHEGMLPQLLLPVQKNIKLFFGDSTSPLKRLIKAASIFFENDFFLRVDAINFFIQKQDAINLWHEMRERDLDCVKFPDDYPIQLSLDGYKRSALQKLDFELSNDSPFIVHPKYALFNRKSFNTSYYQPKFTPNDSGFKNFREIAKQLYVQPRDEILSSSIRHGDTLSFHYSLAINYLKKEDCVLDIACGGSAGPSILAQKAASVIGADISNEVIQRAKTHCADIKNLSFQIQNVEKMDYDNNNFDVVTSFETIEHVDAKSFLQEISRVLKPGGILLLSSPQNSNGKIPINPQHNIEFSQKEILGIVESRFKLIEFYGIKQGCIYFEGDSKGTNSFLVLKKTNQ